MGGERTMRMKLTFGPPEVIIERRPDGVMLARSPHALGSHPRAATDWLDHWAKVAPERVFLAEREPAGGSWRKLTYGEARAACAQRRAGPDRPQSRRRTAGRDPLRQQRRSRAHGARRSDRRRPVRACVGPLFARRQGFRQAQGDHRRPDARPGFRRRRRAVRRRDRGGRAGRCRDRRKDQSAPDSPHDDVRRDARDEGRGRRRPRPGEGRAGHDRQAPVHLGLDRHAEGSHQHPSDDDLEPGNAARRQSELRRRAAGPDRLAAVEPHLRRQQQFQSRARQWRLVLHRRGPAAPRRDRSHRPQPP